MTKPDVCGEVEYPVKLTTGGRPRSEASRVALLETAYSLMKEHSLATITTHQIAAKAGVSTNRISLVDYERSSFGRCFPSRQTAECASD